MPGVRFTTWLDADEYKALTDLAEANSCSKNFLARIALRALLFDKPVPSYLQKKDTTGAK